MENAGPGSRGTGYGVPGCGKHGVWKTRGLMENTGSQWKTRGLSARHRETISPNNEVEILLFQIAMKNNRRETRFLVIEENHCMARWHLNGFLSHEMFSSLS